MLTWMAYAIALTLVFGVAAALWEKAAVLGRWSARYGWIVAVALSISVPIAQSLWPASSPRQIVEIAAGPLRATGWNSALMGALSQTTATMPIAALNDRW